jgi:hypothetical protein
VREFATSYFRSLLNRENYYSYFGSIEPAYMGDLNVLHSPTVPDPLVFYLT